MKRLAIITTHPVQYNAPLFALLARRGKMQIKVFYTWGESVLGKKYDPGFGKNIEWDIPLLEGYEHCFVKNIAINPGSHHFRGIDNPSLINEIEQWRADALLVYGWAFKSHLKILRYYHRKIPVYFRGDSTSLNQKKGIRKYLRSCFLKWVYAHIDKALYVGTNNKNYFLEYGLKPSQLVFAPHAIDNERFEMRSRESVKTRVNEKNELGIGDEETIFLYAGKLDENKNTALLLGAFLSAGVSGSFLLIAGNGTQELELKAAFSHYKNIRFIPFRNQLDMPSLYGITDVFVLPSKKETWGLGINEAMACGRAVLASDTCGAAIDLIKDGINGYVFKSNDGTDLREKIIKLAGNKKELKTMGSASAKIIRDWSYLKDCETIEALM